MPDDDRSHFRYVGSNIQNSLQPHGGVPQLNSGFVLHCMYIVHCILKVCRGMLYHLQISKRSSWRSRLNSFRLFRFTVLFNNKVACRVVK